METEKDKTIEYLEKKINELEKKEKKKKSFSWIINLIGWVFLIGIIVLIWLNIKPILAKINSALSIFNKSNQVFQAGGNTANEVLNKVNHPIDTSVDTVKSFFK